MSKAEQAMAEQIIYSKTEHQEKITVEITAEKGLQAKIVDPPKTPNVKVEISGAV
jgi:hypothetical protein